MKYISSPHDTSAVRVPTHKRREAPWSARRQACPGSAAHQTSAAASRDSTTPPSRGRQSAQHTTHTHCTCPRVPPGSHQQPPCRPRAAGTHGRTWRLQRRAPARIARPRCKHQGVSTRDEFSGGRSQRTRNPRRLSLFVAQNIRTTKSLFGEKIPLNAQVNPRTHKRRPPLGPSCMRANGMMPDGLPPAPHHARQASGTPTQVSAHTHAPLFAAYSIRS